MGAGCRALLCFPKLVLCIVSSKKSGMCITFVKPFPVIVDQRCSSLLYGVLWVKDHAQSISRKCRLLFNK